jgi:tetratricopeptide (TPR) repeat protein
MAQKTGEYHLPVSREYLSAGKIYLFAAFLFLFTHHAVFAQVDASDSLNQLFRNALRESRFDDAMEYGERYYGMARQEKDQGKIFESMTNMFVLYRQTGNYEKSFDYAEQLYDIALKSENKKCIKSALWGLAELYTNIEDYATSLNYYRRVWELNYSDTKNTRVESETSVRFEMQFADVFSLSHQFDSALHYYQLYRPSQENLKRFYLVSMGEYYFLKGDYQMALRQLQPALLQNQLYKDANEEMRTVLDLARTYLALDNSGLALSFGRKGLEMSLNSKAIQRSRDAYQLISDSYARLSQTDSSNYYFRKYTVLKDVVLNDQAKGRFAAFNYEQRISLMNKEKEIQAIQLQKQTLIKNFLIGGMIILLITAISFFRNITLKRKSDARRRELVENELRIQKLESEKATVELLQQRAELEMKALRAQMNPHFIFNCLNSINRFIISNDAEKAADYLTKFAKLIRMVLEKSGNPFITLEEELDCLKLYMDLEALRFEKPFQYEINSYGIDRNAVMVPSMMIQPFIENAIWHGLHASRTGTGKINLNMHLDNGFLNCEISDNGIGMKAAMSGKSNVHDNKKSMGIELTRNRLRLADPAHYESMGITIRDLTDEPGEITGTSILIKIPVQEI